MDQITARTFYYFLDFYLDGVPEPVIYEAPAEDAERLQSILHRLEYSPEDQAAIEDKYFYFITPDRQQVVVHLPDIQAVRILIERKLHQVRRRRLYYLPRLWAYLRGRSTPIVEDLDDADPGDHYSLLSAHFFDAALDDPSLPKMLSYLNVEGDRCVLNRRHLMLWAIDWEYRVSLTTVFEADGIYQAGRDDETGIWRIQVWRLREDLFDEEELPSEWYANVEFAPVGQPGEDEGLYEFDTYGPYPTKSEAVAAAQADFESGRYRHHITQLREPGSLDEEEI